MQRQWKYFACLEKSAGGSIWCQQHLQYQHSRADCISLRGKTQGSLRAQ